MPYTFRQGDLPKLDLEVDKGSDFIAWTDQWEAYRTLYGLSDEEATKQANVLRLCFTRDTLTTVNNLGLTQGQKNDRVAIIEALRNHVEGQINVKVERRNFRKRKQQLGETFDDFLCSLRELAKTCQFCNDACAQNNIRDQIIEGLADSDTVQELLKEQNLTLPNTITTCRGMEATKKEVTIMKGTSIQRVNYRKTGNKNETKQKRKQSSPTNTDATQNSAPKSQRKCNGCGKSFHEGGCRNCPAINIVCYSCGEIGHFKSVCPSENKDNDIQDNDVSVNALNFNKNVRLWSISAVTAEPPAPTVLPHARGINGEADIQVLPDSGANICAAGTQFLTKLGEHMDNINESDIEPQAVNGNTMTPLGCLPAMFLTAGGKPAGDKPAGDKPAGDKPAGDKPAGDKPAGDKPAGDKPAGDKPAGDKPAGDKPAGDKPAGDKPAGDKPAGDKPAGDKPAGDKPAGDKPAGDKPAGDKPAGDKPAGDKPAGDKPAGDKPAGDKPAGDKPAGDKPAGDKPAGDKPAGDKPAGDKPAGDKPAGDKPAGDKPARGKPQHQRAQEGKLQEKPWEEQPQEEQFQNQRDQEERFQHQKTQVKEFQHQKLKRSSFKRSLRKSSLKKSSVDIESLKESNFNIESSRKAASREALRRAVSRKSSGKKFQQKPRSFVRREAGASTMQ